MIKTGEDRDCNKEAGNCN